MKLRSPLDYGEIFDAPDLAALARVLRADGVPFGVWSRPWDGTCSLFVDVPRNGIAVELRSENFDGDAWLSDACATSEFDLCAAA